MFGTMLDVHVDFKFDSVPSFPSGVTPGVELATPGVICSHLENLRCLSYDLSIQLRHEKTCLQGLQLTILPS